MEKQRKIDIIIPIYNAYDDLQKCISSILTHTNLEHHRMILVNDASPDPRISPYLRTLEKTNVVVLANEKNLGFSGSINRGIQVSGDRDVILLNSDTIVTKNWVEKIIACAYSDETIATVTPLSNNATLCSVPEFLKENTLPDGYTLDEYAQLIEQISLKAYPRIPVANGFCMYIKREVIEKIGVFDSATFGRGYGEENDFCYRAEQIGYCHAMCDDTYIYHTGTTSFVSEEKRKYIEAHDKILNDRYQEQNREVAIHCRNNPNAWIQENIKICSKMTNRKKNILYLVQSDFRENANDHLGGTQLHVKDMMTVMRKTYNVFVAARDLEYLNLTVYTENEEVSFHYYIGKAPMYPAFRDKKFAELYGKILETFQIDLVHIHHTKDLTLELYYEAEKRKIPVITTLHDYFSVCPSIKMLNCCGKLCAGNRAEECCEECAQHMYGIYKNIDYISIWREENKKALQISQKIIVPSESAKKILIEYYTEFQGKFQVVYHGMDKMERKDQSESRELHVAFIGGISKEKGSEIASRLIKSGPNDVKWFLFGMWGYNELSMLDKRNYTKTGLYERHELPDLMEKYQIDVVCLLPIWPETYCYTLSEAIMCGVPVIATDIGALGERMRKLQCGWLVSVENAYEETINIIRRIKDKNAEYQFMRKKAIQLPVKTLGEMGDEYLKIYEETIRKENKKEKLSIELRKFLIDGYLMAQGKKICFAADGEEIQKQLEQKEAQLYEITHSFTYKGMKALGEIPIPGRKYIKKVLYFGYNIIRRH